MSAREVIAWTMKSLGAFDPTREADAVLVALHAAGYRILGPDEVDAMTLEEVETQAEQIMLDVANEWHRQIGIDEVLKSKLVKRIADTVATGVFSRAIRALASGERTPPA